MVATQCKRCGRPIPTDMVVCPCFADDADKEQKGLHCSRFLNREITMLVAAGHAFNPWHSSTYCDTKVSKTTALQSSNVTCPMCRAAIEHHAKKYRDKHGS